MSKKSSKSFGKVGQIFNTGLNSTSLTKVLAFVRDSLTRGYEFWLSTPNPEIILAARRDKELQKALADADLSIPDGIGLAQAAKFLALPAPANRIVRLPVLLFQGAAVGLATFINREWLFSSLRIIKGRKLFIELVKLASKKRWKIFLLGGGPGVARRAGLNFRKTFKRVRIAYFAGPRLDRQGNPVSEVEKEVERQAIAQINEFQPQLLFVAFGAPKQEKWVFKHLSQLNIGGAMVIGGAIDYLAGEADLPPKWAEEAGLEWLWRLVKQPWRVKRILTAFPVFPLKVFWSKLAL
jgi:N-acetylglucosaminyldiphosphoundecaprenol N-acetyl-beta-D-mannosaminyltransferase